MSKHLYEEALADVKRVKEVAEADATRSVLDVLTPRIREMIEEELLREVEEDTEDTDDAGPAPGSVEPKGQLIIDTTNESDEQDDSAENDVGTPVVSETDGVSESAEYELSLESIKAISPIVNVRPISDVIHRMKVITSAKNELNANVSESQAFCDKIDQMVSRVEDTYEYVQESVTDIALKSSFESELETHFKDLSELREQMMLKRNRNRVDEGDVTLKLTGLPDDIDLDSVGVDLVTDEEEGSGEVAPGEETGGDELDLSSLGGDEEESTAPAPAAEGRRLSDDTIIEIDEGMLRKEIARIKRLREEAVPSADGKKPGSKEFDDFGGARDEGEAFLDGEVETDGFEVTEGEENEMDELDELDLPEADDAPPPAAGQGNVDQQNNSQNRMPESLKRRMAFENRLRERARVRAETLKSEAIKARANNQSRKEAFLKAEYTKVAKHFNESLARTNEMKKMLSETTQAKRSQNGRSERLAESKTVNDLREKLTESNLNNAKLAYTNKLLQNESLTARQKARIIEQLDSATTIREAKLVYESLSRTLVSTDKVPSAPRVIGSSSRATGRASTQPLTEGYEAERWSKLAGITK